MNHRSQRLYPSKEFFEEYSTYTPAVFAGVVALTFVVIVVCFFLYDRIVQRRNEKIIQDAARSNAIVSSMFPGQIRDRILNQVRESKEKTAKHKSVADYVKGDDESHSEESQSLAEFFPAATICFSDIVGFTAWSSVREPTQVFTLLGTTCHCCPTMFPHFVSHSLDNATVQRLFTLISIRLLSAIACSSEKTKHKHSSFELSLLHCNSRILFLTSAHRVETVGDVSSSFPVVNTTSSAILTGCGILLIESAMSQSRGFHSSTMSMSPL